MKIWELGMKAHQRAMGEVHKVTDQSAPEGFHDVSLKKARERARNFILDQQRKQIEDENMALLGHIVEIVEKPSVTSKLIEEVPQPPKKKVQRHEVLRKRMQSHIQRENEAMVRRLATVKSCMNLKGYEKDYQRHKDNVVRLQNVTELDAPGPPPRKKRPRKLPVLETAPAAPSGAPKEHVRQGRGGSLPPLQKSPSAPTLTSEGRKRAENAAARDGSHARRSKGASRPAEAKLAWGEGLKSPSTIAMAAGADFAGLGSRGSSRMSIEDRAGTTALSWLACSTKSFTPASDIAFEACADVLDAAFDAAPDILADSAASFFSSGSARHIELCSDDENSLPPSTPLAARLATDDALSSILASAMAASAISP